MDVVLLTSITGCVLAVSTVSVHYGSGCRGCRHRVSVECVVGPLDDSLTSMNIHCIKNALAVTFGQLIFVDCGQNTGFLTLIQCDQRQEACGIHPVGSASNAGQGFLYPAKIANRYIELVTNPGIGPG